MKLGRRVARFLFWGLVLCFSSAAGGLWFAYWYITDSATISRIIREHAVRYLPRASLDPGRVHPDIFAGELVMRNVKLHQAIDGAMFETLRIPYLSLQVNPQKLAKGEFAPSKIVVGTPTLRLRGRKNGTWNLEGLLADPWPGPWIETPPIQIKNGTIELYPCEEPVPGPVRPIIPPAASLVKSSAPSPPGSPTVASPPPIIRPAAEHSPALLRDVTLNIKPSGKHPRELSFDGSASGDGFERLTLSGSIDLITGNIELAGELAGLVVSDSLRRKLPPAHRAIPR